MPRFRLPKTPLLLGAGILSAGLLGLTGTGTLSSITAAITTSPDTASLSRLVLELKSGAQSCLSSSGTGNTFTCTTVQPLSGRTDLLPGGSATTDVVATNRGSFTPSSFVLTTSPCTGVGDVTGSTTQAAKDAICSKAQVTVAISGGTTTTYAASAIPSTIALVAPGPGDANARTVTFTVSMPSDLTNDYQGLGISVPMTWTLTQ